MFKIADSQWIILMFVCCLFTAGHAEISEKELYLTPGGKYSQKDIIANGEMTRSQKFASFKASHNPNPKTGEKICPVTLTKANSECTWVVDGKDYQFCCPICIDEFLLLAKEHPDQIKDPEFYIAK